MSPSLAFIAQLRTTIGDHPFVTFLLLTILWRVAYAAMHLGPRAISDRTAAAIGAIGISVYASIAIWYAVVVSSRPTLLSNSIAFR